MPIRSLRRAAAAAAVAAAGVLTHAAAKDAVPASVAEKAFTADATFLVKGLSKEPVKREVPTLKAVAMLAALAAQDAGAADARDQALKVAELIAAKNYKDAGAAAGKLTPPKGSGASPVELATLHKFDLSEVMSTFRAGTVGGLNLEKDVKAYSKKVADVDQAGVIGARLALIAVYTKALPPSEATGGKKAQWDGWSDEMKALGEKAAAEAGKGAAADKAGLAKTFNALNANCVACHNVFRN